MLKEFSHGFEKIEISLPNEGTYLPAFIVLNMKYTYATVNNKDAYSHMMNNMCIISKNLVCSLKTTTQLHYILSYKKN